MNFPEEMRADGQTDAGRRTRDERRARDLRVAQEQAARRRQSQLVKDVLGEGVDRSQSQKKVCETDKQSFDGTTIR